MTKAALTHCKRGHELSGDNLYIAPKSGARNCRTCKVYHTNRWRKSNHDAYLKEQRERKDIDRFGSNRERAIKRDGGRCVSCGMTREEHRILYKRDITVDHVDGQGRYSDAQNNNLDNLQTLCLSCHGTKDILRRWGKPFQPKERISKGL